MNGPNKRELKITLDWKGLPKINTLAYWTHSQVTEKMKYFKYVGRLLFRANHPRRFVVPLLHVAAVGHLIEIVILFTSVYFIATAYSDPGNETDHSKINMPPSLVCPKGP